MCKVGGFCGGGGGGRQPGNSSFIEPVRARSIGSGNKNFVRPS